LRMSFNYVGFPNMRFLGWTRSGLPLVGACILLVVLSGCYSLPQSSSYTGPIPRPLGLEEYYARDNDIQAFEEDIREQTDEYTIRRYLLTTKFGPVTIDYYEQHEKSDAIVLVFPVLGGRKNPIENYFCRYFAQRGLDAAIIHRSEDFKKPENFDRIEELNRKNIIRDRLAMDFFQDHIGKRRFGSFGISRGAINVAMTAGVDKRLEFNVMALGGSDLVRIFHKSDQPRIRMIMSKVLSDRDMSWPELRDLLYSRIKTDPKYLARYIDARKSLMFLGLFDRTVPIQSGFRLRHEIGNPETIVLTSGHYTAGAYTGFLKLVPPGQDISIFPIDFVEGESLSFYRRSFGIEEHSLRFGVMRVIRYPFDLIGRVFHAVFERGTDSNRDRPTPFDTPLMEASAGPYCAVQ
jgi:hypothetical protein